MACCEPELDKQAPVAYRNALIAVLAINLVMFGVEAAVGLFSGSRALRADALDFLGDSATYAMTLIVLGMSLRWRAGAAMIKGLAMGGFGIWVMAATVYHMSRGTLPDFNLMGGVGALALLANIVSAGLLYWHRQGDSNMRSVWLCSRNDAIANIAVILAAGSVWASGSGWPDLAVGGVIAALALSSSFVVIRQARGELRAEAA